MVEVVIYFDPNMTAHIFVRLIVPEEVVLSRMTLQKDTLSLALY